ncbi:MAG: MATE family efflux transporter [Lachnospiraceae bacterium]|nr:MATE family efflux transporter [Lachnospiraceae bacterium]
MKDFTTDMTKGSPVKHILLFSLPALIGNIFQQIYNLADTLIVGRFLGKDALAAVGASASITFLFFALCNGIGSGGGIIASQYYGAHDDEKVKNTIFNTGFIMLLVPVVFGSIGYVITPWLLELLMTPAKIMADATMYVRFMCIGLLFVSMYNYIASMLRALGDSKSPLIFLIVSTIINIVLDILFIWKFNMGIMGAAVATVIAQFISVLGSGIYAVILNPYFKLKKENFNISGGMIYKVLKLGVPMSLQFALIAISTMALQRVVNSFENVAVVAAFTATGRIEQIVHQPYQTLCASLGTFCGQNYGAKKTDRVFAGYRKGMLIMIIISIVMFAVMQVFGKEIISLFVDDAEVIELGAYGLKITSLFYIALGSIYVIRGVLTGVGDAFFALFNGIIEVIGRFTIPVILISFLGFGATGIWAATGFVWLISGVTAWLRYYFRLRNEMSGVQRIHGVRRALNHH